jgi:hypothetical protein
LAFGFLGAVGFIWVAAWIVLGKEGPLDAHHVEGSADGLAHVPYSTLLTSRTFIGVTLAGFSAYWAVTLAVVWLPSFLVKAGGYSPTATGWIVMLPPLLQACLSPTLGFVSQRLLARGVSSRVSRGMLTCFCVMLAGTAMLLLSKSESELVQQRGAMLGICNGTFTLAGLIAPWLMGHIVDVGINPAQGFRDGFMFAGLLIVAGGALAMILINPNSDLERFRRREAGVAGHQVPVLQS